MKSLLIAIKFLSLSLFLILLTNCKTTQKLYLQDVEINGPINQSPIHITDSSSASSAVLSLRFSYNPQKNLKAQSEGTPMVNSQGFFQVDTFYNNDGTITYRQTPGVNNFQYQSRNLTWNFATVTVGFDLDVKLTNNFALFTGASYAGSNNKSAWGGTAGLGVFGESNGMAFRLDAGLHIQSINYDAYTIAEITETSLFSSSEEYVIFYHDMDNSTHFDPFVNFTYNTAKRDWLLNFFFNAGYSVQTIVDFPPEKPNPVFYFPPFIPIYVPTIVIEDLRGESIAGFAHFTPGIYFQLFDKGRLLLGTRIYFETQLKNATTNVFFLPMMQVDFTL